MDRKSSHSIVFVLFLLIHYGSYSENFWNGFVMNKGQIVDQNFKANTDVLYQYIGKNVKVQLRKNGYSYEIFQAKNLPLMTAGERMPKDVSVLKNTKLISHRIDINFINSNSEIEITGEYPSNAFINYSVNGNDVNAIRSFKKVVYTSIYKNIDLVFSIDETQDIPVKYDYILKPGSDIKDIELVCNGATKINQDLNGDLLFETSLGTIREKIPLSYYTSDKGKNIPINFVLKGNTITLHGLYDSNKTLVIDPTSNLVWGNYAGGPSLEYSTSLCIDSQNNLFKTGYTLSPSNIATSGVFQATLSGSFDGYLLKYNTSGNLIWGTYFGGTDVEAAYSVFADASGNIYVGGDTFSNSNIASVGSHQPSYGGGIDDAMLFKFDTNGQRLWSTYFGGTEHDIIGALTVDGAGNVIICGHTESSNAIATPGAYSTFYASAYDAYVAKFNPQGILQWATYFGDTGVDEAWGIDCDSQNNVYITGFTSSLFSISTPTAHQGINGGGNNDAFIAKFNPSGTNLIWGTYYGGSGDENGSSLEINSAGEVILSGTTTSTLNISSASAFQSALAGAEDGYLAKFNQNGVRLWGTYLGGADADYIHDVYIDPVNNILFCGQTLSQNGIGTLGAYQPTISNVNNYDAFFAKMSDQGSLIWGSYYGGPENENSKGIVLDTQGKLYLSGETTSSVGISTPSSPYPNPYGGPDAFISKFCIESVTSLTPATTASVCLGGSITISAPAGCQSYTWSTSETTSSITPSYTTAIGSFTYSVKVVDADGCDGASDTLQVDVLDCITSLTNNVDLNGIKVYPNPATHDLTIAAEFDVKQMDASVYDVTGKCILKQTWTGNTNILSINELVPGIYLLELNTSDGRYYQKFIKQ